MAGRDYRYLITIRNPAPWPAWDAHLDVRLPLAAGLGAVGSGTGGWCRSDSGDVDCEWGLIPGQARLAVAFTVRVDPGVAAAVTRFARNR